MSFKDEQQLTKSNTPAVMIIGCLLSSCLPANSPPTRLTCLAAPAPVWPTNTHPIISSLPLFLSPSPTPSLTPPPPPSLLLFLLQSSAAI